MSENGKKKASKEEESDDSSSGEFEMGSSSSSDDSSDEDSQKQNEHSNRKEPPPQTPAKKPATTDLELPTFALEDDQGKPLDPNRYELWSLRLPALLPLSALENCELSIPASSSANVAGGTLSSQANQPATLSTDKGDSFTLRWGNKVENESFRLLVPGNSKNESDSDSDDSDSDEKPSKKVLTPANLFFQRHVNVVSQIDDLVATQVAPGADRAPKPDAQSAVIASGPFTKLRKAYQPVPQKKGLKRRWMPLGSGSAESGSSLAKRPSTKPDSDSDGSVESPKVAKKRKNSNSEPSNTQAMKRKRSSSENGKKKARTESMDKKVVKRKRSSSETSRKETPIKEEPVKRKRSSSENNKKDQAPPETVDEKPNKNGEKKLTKAEKKARKTEKKAKSEKKEKKDKKKKKDKKTKVKKEKK